MNTKYKRINITLPKDLLEKFRAFCKRNGINMSSRISLLVERDLREKNPLN